MKAFILKHCPRDYSIMGDGPGIGYLLPGSAVIVDDEDADFFSGGCWTPVETQETGLVLRADVLRLLSAAIDAAYRAGRESDPIRLVLLDLNQAVIHLPPSRVEK